MNTSKDTNASDSHQLVNEQRRRLAKGGLAAPVVIGALLSRPVLGAAPHKCTISGQLSGNVSTHGTTVLCSSLGQTPAYYAGIAPSSWPNAATDFLNNGSPRAFADTPFSRSPKFADAFERYNTANNNTGVATVLDVLQGDWDLNNANRTLRVRLTGGFDTANGKALGMEAVAAYMNAADQTKYPITQQDVVAMFNSVIVLNGLYHYSSTVTWNASQVLAYFRSLHP
jgi:hypothetical protein